MKTHTYDKHEDNPNDTSKSALQLFCEFMGWQGGTIHQAIAAFKELPKGQQDKFCGVLIDNMFNMVHLEDIQTFMKIRNDHLTTKSI